MFFSFYMMKSLEQSLEQPTRLIHEMTILIWRRFMNHWTIIGTTRLIHEMTTRLIHEMTILIWHDVHEVLCIYEELETKTNFVTRFKWRRVSGDVTLYLYHVVTWHDHSQSVNRRRSHAVLTVVFVNVSNRTYIVIFVF